ncbi:MAG: MFS transporter [Candidatus Melainabacteria bacterium]|nr:MFS transporter [Candidatus Melainabacteria bacterium]
MSEIEKWEIEDKEFWTTKGSTIAYKNLWVSIFCLMLAFCVWMSWSIITVQMKNLGFPFNDEQLFTLTAVAGLTGATLRIPYSFLVGISGGRNIIALTTFLLLVPAVGIGIALQDIGTPFLVFVTLAALSGIGGGVFASSMSNISSFFPKRMQGLALGLNAGLGNFGVSVTQIVIPVAISVSIFGTLCGNGRPLLSALGSTPAGTLTYIQNGGFVWIPFLILGTIFAWFGMDNLPVHKIGPAISCLVKIFWLTFLGFVSSSFGLYLLLVQKLDLWVVLPLTIIVTLVLMDFTPKQVRLNLNNQYEIFKNKHNWIVTLLYIMTFGTFIGYSAAFPLFIKVIFGYLPGGVVNPNAPNPFYFAWLGPFVGSLIRPIGGWLSDKVGGAKVTHVNTVIMTICVVGIANLVKLAKSSPNPEQHFILFLLVSLVLFFAVGIGNGAIFRKVPVIFEAKQAGPVLGWISAVAAYGAFIIPKLFGASIEAGTPELALYNLAAFYVFCLLLNWWYYAREGAEVCC